MNDEKKEEPKLLFRVHRRSKCGNYCWRLAELVGQVHAVSAATNVVLCEVIQER